MSSWCLICLNHTFSLLDLDCFHRLCSIFHWCSNNFASSKQNKAWISKYSTQLKLRCAHFDLTNTQGYMARLAKWLITHKRQFSRCFTSFGVADPHYSRFCTIQFAHNSVRTYVIGVGSCEVSNCCTFDLKQSIVHNHSTQMHVLSM